MSVILPPNTSAIPLRKYFFCNVIWIFLLLFLVDCNQLCLLNGYFVCWYYWRYCALLLEKFNSILSEMLGLLGYVYMVVLIICLLVQCTIHKCPFPSMLFVFPYFYEYSPWFLEVPGLFCWIQRHHLTVHRIKTGDFGMNTSVLW